MYRTIPQLLPHFSPLSLRWPSKLGVGVVGVCLYIAGFALPLQWDVSLLGLGLLSAFAVTTRSQASAPAWSSLALLVLAFLAVTALSTLLSIDIVRSVRLSTPLLPAVLLFFLVAEHFDGPRDIRLLYLTFSLVGLGLASALLGAAWHTNNINNLRVSSFGVPLLVVPNDLTFLALIAPLSLVLLYREAREACGIIAALSIFLSLCAAFVFRSRAAVLTTVISLACVMLLTQRRRRLVTGLAAILALLLLALLVNALFFPDTQLVAKIIREWGTESGRTLDGRTPLWSTAWTLFLNAPILGQGPHTFGVFKPSSPWVHNLYLEALAEQGILGFAALGVLLAYGLSAAWKLHRIASGDAALYGSGALAGLVGFCAAAVVELSFVRQWVVIILFVLLGVIAQLSSINRDREVKR
jgi:O-antigen ligase